MCHFKSAIILLDERNKGGFAILHSPATDSHSDLISAHNLRDDGTLRFARVEYLPGEDWANLDAYALRLDEARTPAWYTLDMADAVKEKMRVIVKQMIAKDGQYLLGGSWIVPKDVTVAVGPNTRVVVNRGNVTDNRGTVTDNRGTVTTNHGTVTANHGTVTANSNRGIVTANRGIVTDNRGTVTDNRGTVTTNSNIGIVTDNYGIVTDNRGNVTDNWGTVTTNRGTVTDNHGTVTANSNIGIVAVKPRGKSK